MGFRGVWVRKNPRQPRSLLNKSTKSGAGASRAQNPTAPRVPCSKTPQFLTPSPVFPYPDACAVDASCLEEGSEREEEEEEAEKNLTVLDGSAGDLLLRLMHLAGRQQGKQQPGL